MTNFSVASLAQNDALAICGQGFCPNDPGPEGSGPPTVSPVKLLSASFVFPTGAPPLGGLVCYVYDVRLTDPSQISQDEGLVATSNRCDPGESSSGGPCTVTFSFSGVFLDPSATYYLYLSSPQVANIHRPARYTGGDVQDADCSDDPECTAQFTVSMDDEKP